MASSGIAFTAPPRRAGAAAAPMSAFGGGDRGDRGGFSESAAAAFGSRKPPTVPRHHHEDEPPKPIVPRNTIAALLEGILPSEESESNKNWSKSALQKQRKEAVPKKAGATPKSYDQEFPTLGGAGVGGAGGGSPVVPKVAVPTTTVPAATSFAKLATSWAKADEERQAEEARQARLRLEQRMQEMQEASERRRFYSSIHSHHMEHHSGYNHGGHNDFGYDLNDDEYIEGELGEEYYCPPTNERFNEQFVEEHPPFEEEDEY